MFLTSPLIDQALTLIDPVTGVLSVIGMFRQQPFWHRHTTEESRWRHSN